MPRILILSYEFPPMLGGAGSVAMDLASFLGRSGYEVAVAASSEVAGDHVQAPFSILPVPAVRYVRLVLFWLAIRRHVDAADIIIVNDKRYHIAASLFFGPKERDKTIVYLHGDEDADFLLRPRPVLRLLGMRRRYRALLEGARLLVACSAFQKERFIRNTGLRSLDGKIAVVRNGVDPRLFHHEPGNVRAELGIDPGKTLLLSVSRVAKGKGFDTKYDLFRRLLARDPGFHWIVIGQGDYLGELRRLVRAGGLEGSVTLLGGIPRDRLRRWYSSCDVFWLLSELEESFGLVYAEAALCGTPSIGYAAAGAREAIMDGTTGFLVRTGEDALEILEKRSFSALSRQDIARRAQAFSSDAMQSLWLHELHRVLAARSGGQ